MPITNEDEKQLLRDCNRLYGLLRDVRAEAQNLFVAVEELQEKGKLADPQVRERELRTTLQRRAPLYQRNRLQMEALLAQARALFQQNAEVYSLFGDEVTHLENFVERAKDCWPDGNVSVDQLLHLLGENEGWLKKVIWHCGLVTIPPRVDEHLQQLRVGHPLVFTREFQDELPSDAERAELLQFMHDHPSAISGVVDVARGLIFKASPDPKQRWRSVTRIVLWVLAGAGLVALAAWGGPRLPDSFVPTGLLQPLLLGYGFVFLGGVVHVGVDSLKQRRAATAPTFFALDDWLLWIHVRETSVLMGVFSLWLGLAMLAVARHGVVSWQEAFLVGYGIDSFMELFLQRFDRIVSSGTEALKKNLNPSDNGKAIA